MWRYLFLFFIFSCLFVQAKAQLPDSILWIEAGFTLSDVRTGGILNNTEARRNIQVTVLGHKAINASNSLGITAGAGYTKRGYIQVIDGEDYFYRNNYVRFPVMLSWTMFRFLTLEAGAEYAFMFSSRYKAPGVNRGLGKYFNRNDFLLIGAVNVPANKRISVFGRYCYGLVPMLEYNEIGPFGEPGRLLKIRNLALELGIRVNLLTQW